RAGDLRLRPGAGEEVVFAFPACFGGAFRAAPFAGVRRGCVHAAPDRGQRGSGVEFGDGGQADVALLIDRADGNVGPGVGGQLEALRGTGGGGRGRAGDGRRGGEVFRRDGARWCVGLVIAGGACNAFGDGCG